MNYKLCLLFLIIQPISLLAQDKGYFKGKEFKKPIREYSIIATDEGYFPNKLFAYVGEKVKFFVTTTSEKSQCFLIKDHSIFLGAEKGKMAEGEVSFYTPGRFEFYCPSNNFKGHISVIAKEEEKVKKAKRNLASKKPDHWMPRNYD